MDALQPPDKVKSFGQLEFNWFVWLFRFWTWPNQPRPCSIAVKFKETREYLDMDYEDASKLLGVPVDEIKAFELGF
jgi:hypothetical protein